jgi:hypothetical protein
MTNFKRAEKLTTTVLPDGYVAIFSAATNCAYTLPPIGALAWEFFDGDHSIDDIVNELLAVVVPSSTLNAADLRQQISLLAEELEASKFLE